MVLRMILGWLSEVSHFSVLSGRYLLNIPLDRNAVVLHQASDEINKMKRLLFPSPFVAETDGIL
jgi:hypothetical protein